MDANSLEKGVTYFRITHADVARTMPGVEPLVYAGLNLWGPSADGVARYYFQDAVSVVRFGLGIPSGQDMQTAGETSCLNPEDDEGRLYWAHEASEIGEVIVDLPTLAAEIDSTLQRAAHLGFPKLSKAKGPWV